MAGNTWWIPDKDGKKHPQDSILLAYVRGQQLEDRLRISRHINVEQCQHCRHKCHELVQVSVTLDVLGQMPLYQDYPELSVDQTFSYVQRAANKHNPLQGYLEWVGNRQRPRKSAMRLISLPVAFGLALFLVVLVVLAAQLSGVLRMSGPLQGHTSPSQNNSTAIIPHQTTPTSDLALTATANAALTSKPDIKVCSTHKDIIQFRLVICGYHFEPGHKVSLVVVSPGDESDMRDPVMVNKQGKFQDTLYISNCSNVPPYIFPYDVTSQKSYSTTLENISFASCPVPTATGGVAVNTSPN
jgi:hypothetical protein